MGLESGTVTEKWLGCFNYFSKERIATSAGVSRGPLGGREKMGVTVRFGVEEDIRGKLMIVLLPWKTLGLIGLGPKAQSTARAQNLPTCTAVPMRTREAVCALGSCCGEKLAPGLIHIVSKSWKPSLFLFPRPATPSTTVRTTSQPLTLCKLDYKPLFSFNLHYSI